MSWTHTASINFKTASLTALCLGASLLSPGFSFAQTPNPDAAAVLALYKQALSPNGAAAPRSIESTGTVAGAQLHGTFHSWHQDDRSRFDETLGVRSDRSLQLGERRFEQNSSGDVIELKGVLMRRGVTQDFIGSPDLFAKPQYAKLVGETKLDDGSDVFRVDVSPPDGETETIYLDAATHLLDRLEYVDGDGLFTVDYSDYRPVNGFLWSFKQVQSDGDHPFDIAQTITQVVTNKKISGTVFAPLVPAKLVSDGPVTVPLTEQRGALYAPVVIHGITFTFLVDSGAQGIVLDSRVATRLGLLPEGSFEARGASRIGGIGVASLDKIHIGAATLPVNVCSILDLAGSTDGRFAIDGILGYALFGAAMVQIDPAKKTMTLAAPGALRSLGAKFDIDVDRELPEVMASVNGIDGRFLVDTGNGNELLLFHPFLLAHAGLFGPQFRSAASGYGVGGATRAMAATVDTLDLGPYHLYHRATSLIQSTQGAFADRVNAGNIGLGVLSNFIVTFDAYNRVMYLSPGSEFNDGRDRRPTL